MHPNTIEQDLLFLSIRASSCTSSKVRLRAGNTAASVLERRVQAAASRGETSSSGGFARVKPQRVPSRRAQAVKPQRNAVGALGTNSSGSFARGDELEERLRAGKTAASALETSSSGETAASASRGETSSRGGFARVKPQRVPSRRAQANAVGALGTNSSGGFAREDELERRLRAGETAASALETSLSSETAASALEARSSGHCARVNRSECPRFCVHGIGSHGTQVLIISAYDSTGLELSAPKIG
ncbi:hypothetical protein B0H11DRAFT_2244791 [Mycena galericulata]|nr:hypothetical protein B0H11DRAFT_2244791 [Mycena galericulata]